MNQKNNLKENLKKIIPKPKKVQCRGSQRTLTLIFTKSRGSHRTFGMQSRGSEWALTFTFLKQRFTQNLDQRFTESLDNVAEVHTELLVTLIFPLYFKGKMTIFWPLITLYIITVKYLIYRGSPTAPLFRPYGLYKHEI